MSVPKIIHYIWIGGDTYMNDTFKMCIDSWHKVLPSDYEIKFWNEKTFDISKFPPIVKQWYDNKQYSFVSDFIRFTVLYEYGGIYLDADIQLLKEFPEEMLSHDMFLAVETPGFIGLGVVGVAYPHHPVIKRWLDRYYSDEMKEYKNSNQTISKDMRARGFTRVMSRPKEVDGVMIYPREVFYPLHYNDHEGKVEENSIAIHHWMYTWKDEEFRKKHQENYTNEYKKIGESLQS